MRLILMLALCTASIALFAQPNNGFLTLNGDTSQVNIKLTKTLGSIDKTIEFFFETCDNNVRLNKMGLLTFPQQGISVSLTTNTTGNAANIQVEKLNNPNFSDIYSVPIYRHNSWNHFAIGYHAIDSTMSIYFNGDSLGTSDSVLLNSSEFFVGGLVTEYFKGNVDDIRLSDGVIYGASYVTPTTLVTNARTDNLFQFDVEQSSGKFISLGNSMDTAYTSKGTWFIEEISVTPDTAICNGDTLKLLASGGSKFSWTSNNNLTNDTVFNPKFVGNKSDTLEVNISNENGCFSMQTIEIIVDEKPVVSLGNDTTICDGDVLLLVAGNFNQYLWSDNSTDSTNAVSTGKHWVEIETTKGCKNADTIVVDNYAISTFNLGNDTLLQTGFTYELKLPTYFSSYLWSTGETTPTILATLPLPYSVTVTDTNGCTASDVIAISYPPVSVTEENLENLQVYPNPTNGIITVSGFSKDQQTNIVVYNSMGKLVKRHTPLNQEETFAFPAEAPNGIYYLKFETSSEGSSAGIQIILRR